MEVESSEPYSVREKAAILAAEAGSQIRGGDPGAIVGFDQRIADMAVQMSGDSDPQLLAGALADYLVTGGAGALPMQRQEAAQGELCPAPVFVPDANAANFPPGLEAGLGSGIFGSNCPKRIAACIANPGGLKAKEHSYLKAAIITSVKTLFRPYAYCNPTCLSARSLDVTVVDGCDGSETLRVCLTGNIDTAWGGVGLGPCSVPGSASYANTPGHGTIWMPWWADSDSYVHELGHAANLLHSQPLKPGTALGPVMSYNHLTGNGRNTCLNYRNGNIGGSSDWDRICALGASAAARQGIELGKEQDCCLKDIDPATGKPRIGKARVFRSFHPQSRQYEIKVGACTDVGACSRCPFGNWRPRLDPNGGVALSCHDKQNPPRWTPWALPGTIGHL